MRVHCLVNNRSSDCEVGHCDDLVWPESLIRRQGGTTLAQQAWLQVLRALQTRPWFEGRLQVSRAGGVFDAK